MREGLVYWQTKEQEEVGVWLEHSEHRRGMNEIRLER